MIDTKKVDRPKLTPARKAGIATAVIWVVVVLAFLHPVAFVLLVLFLLLSALGVLTGIIFITLLTLFED